nr:MAG TPA: hypothetical protein [Caudoviricetes sp.]
MLGCSLLCFELKMKIEKTEELQGFVIKNMLKVSYEIRKNLQKIIKKL